MKVIYKSYINYRHQVLERNLSFEKNEKEAANKNNSDMGNNENLAVSEPANTVKPPGDIQTGSENKEAVNETVKSLAHPGFKQIAPGIFQFKHPSLTDAADIIPSGVASPTPELLGLQTKETPELEEAGFIKISGIPGPFEHYQTPVYQFT